MDKILYQAQYRKNTFLWTNMDFDSDLTALRARIAVKKALNNIGEVRILEITHTEKVIEED